MFIIPNLHLRDHQLLGVDLHGVLEVVEEKRTLSTLCVYGRSSETSYHKVAGCKIHRYLLFQAVKSFWLKVTWYSEGVSVIFGH